MLTLVNLKGWAGPKALPTFAPDGTATFTVPADVQNLKVRQQHETLQGMEHPFQHTLFVNGNLAAPGQDFKEHNQETQIPGKNAWVSTFTEAKGNQLRQMVRVSANSEGDLPAMKEKINRQLLQQLQQLQQLQNLAGQVPVLVIPANDLLLL